MNFDAVEKIANAVLYEGYLLYPYRASAIKNQQRFNFGVLYPADYCEESGDASAMQTECIVCGGPESSIEAKVRFLQMGHEGIERDGALPSTRLDHLTAQPRRAEIAHEGMVSGTITLGAIDVGDGAYKLTLRIENMGSVGHGVARDEALLRSMISVHSILGVERGEFVSAIDPQLQYRDLVASCQNVGTWPVLAGEPGERSLMLSSPIILYDYPQIAPESPGDLFDGTEIDEILALRILTMTDEEKQEIRNGDDRGRHILERTESLPPEHFQKLHGALRGLRESQP